MTLFASQKSRPPHAARTRRRPHPIVAATLALASFAAAIPLPAAVASAAEISRADFFKPGIAPVRNAKSYDVTVVYFLDYQCPVCRQHNDEIARAFAEDRRVRVIYRDTPIFGDQSTVAARVAIAAHMQGKHEPLHLALMRSKGKLTKDAIREAGRKAGLDWARLERDLKANRAKIDALIDHNMALSEAAGISGTPAYVINDVLADGALDYAGMKGEIGDARKRAAARK